ncbi:hypothetical protein WK55_31340 [Burkholderia ubonensis]|uniref:MarR family transcriptional regulator n=1 Tax=Burkholderia ubonensis TaxID=101571 RepID=UPI00075EA528|nr:helix-turn-helix domain-containing protein [Burkholderia ubonensis]KVT65650.1 hypothetical protein WK55_31340 [Burkholderia ubonensis]
MIEQIEMHLAAVEDATAKAISAALGLPQVEVSKTLHKMVGAGTIEREKRAGGGNEYVYWLAGASQPAHKSAANDPTAIGLGGEPAYPNAVFAMDRTTSPQLPPVQGVIDAARDLLMTSAPNEVLQRLRTLHRELVAYESSGNPVYIEPDSHAITSLDMTLQLLSDMRIARDEYAAENASLKEVNTRLKTNNAQLEQRIDSLSGDVRPIGSLFVTVGRSSKPMRHATIEKAQKRGRALVRSEKESEVLVLEPVGRIVRGTEWRPR